MKIAVHLAVVLSFLMLLGACNVFDTLYPDDSTSNFDRALANAEAAIKRDDYNGAYDLYIKALNMRPNSSAARIGIASAIIMRDVFISDIPHLMNSVFNINLDPTEGTNEYADLTDKLKGTKFYDDDVEKYIGIITQALGQAAYWRAPVNSIDPVTGVMAVDIHGMPVVNTNVSDGVIAATNCNSILNYIICKTMEAAFKARENFVIAKNLAASINVDTLTNYSIPTEDEIRDEIYESGNPAATEKRYKDIFVLFHKDFTNKHAQLVQAYTNLQAQFTTTSTNTSLENLTGVAKGLLGVLKNSAGMSTSIIETVSNSVYRIEKGLGKLKDSFDGTGGQINDAFDMLETFQNKIDEFGSMEISTNIAISGIATNITLKHSWFPY